MLHEPLLMHWTESNYLQVRGSPCRLLAYAPTVSSALKGNVGSTQTIDLLKNAEEDTFFNDINTNSIKC